MKVIIVGGGYFGINYLRELAGNCVGVVDTSEERRNFISKNYNVPVFENWRELPSKLEFEGVIIVTPPDSHIVIAKFFAEQGKYVLIEKPLGDSVEECVQLIKYRDKIMAGMIYLYHPEVERLKIMAQEVPIHHIFTRRTNAGPVREYKNALWDLSPHDISICSYILNQNPIGVRCIQDLNYAILSLDYIACQSVSYVSWLGGPKTRLVELVPANQQNRIIFDDMKATLEVSPLRLMLDDFLSKEWDSKCSFQAGLNVLEVLEKAT